MTTPIDPMVAALMTASLAETSRTTEYLMDTMQGKIADLEAELTAIRERVHFLPSGQHMPTPAAIEQALYPNLATIAHYRKGAE